MHGMAWTVPVWHFLELQLCSAVPPTQWYSQSTAPFFGTDVPLRELGQEEKGDLGAIFSVPYTHIYIIHILQ